MKYYVILKGDNVKLLLARKNKDQKWLAQRLEIRPQYLCLLLSNKRNPSPGTRERIIHYLQPCKFDDIFKVIYRKV